MAYGITDADWSDAAILASTLDLHCLHKSIFRVPKHKPFKIDEPILYWIDTPVAIPSLLAQIRITADFIFIIYFFFQRNMFENDLQPTTFSF